MIDTHTHLYLDDFGDDSGAAVRRALDAGVSHMIFPNVDASTVAPMKELHYRFLEETSIAMGLHPTEVRGDWLRVVREMEKELSDGGFVAVGEVGMDLYWDKMFRLEQMEAFYAQLQIAGRLNLPVIIHCREALQETLEVIKSAQPAVPLVFHSFTGSREDVKKIRGICSPMFGINGVVTFKNAVQLRESLHEIGIGNILLETDSPYLSPVPNRGKRNESSNIPYICNKIGEVLGLRSETVSEITDNNARNTFKL